MFLAATCLSSGELIISVRHLGGAWVDVVVKDLRYWAEGPGIDRRGFFPGHQIVPCALGLTQFLKMSTRIFLAVKADGALG
jgi:hypothetical protein